MIKLSLYFYVRQKETLAKRKEKKRKKDKIRIHYKLVSST